ncbi:xanthine dehydrogenase family protein molybdopterin-binding subunit [Actinomycetospora sp. NBRC 106378]|uniref:xanthine dehydrogenase family protein molybdopterin-binding subunit n=1 Tax=Actinomycetospora sp. NBRC 106378 TaxID=3032208 RepID=UPI0024A0C1BD|nr:xanthine dehydrogenase family protein molybdopterin-binding subunit [Actinomycetospora sp. NBRC 106378]GLZ53514.1 aldehyde dehydrogenase [Actinomycetospora sp. NBRC 106378]
MTDTTTTDPAAATGEGFRWIGKPVKRKEDPKLVTGRATYVGDVNPPGMLHAAILASPHAHARIVSIDTSRAKALPGVVAVLTGAEAAEVVGPMTAFCAEPVPQHAIAVEKTRYWGEAVAAVAAVDRYVAEDACRLIDVEYEVLDPLVDMVEAMDPAAVKVHDTLEGNVVFHADKSYGEVDADFARADRVIRTHARWHRMGAQPIETAGAVCSWDPFTASMTIWSNSSFYNFLPWSFASMLGISTSRMRMIPCAVGGSFGSKHLLNKVIAISGALTKVTGKPVRYLEDRLENIAANDNVGCDRIYDGELAITDDGEFLSLKLHCIDDYGAYFQFGPGQHGCALAQPVGPYRINSLQYEVSAVLTNKVQQGFFRGAGADHGNFILERLVDAAADELGIDRAEIRRRNFIQPDQFPYKIPSGNVYDSGDYEGVLDRALTLADVEYWRAEQKRLRAEGRYIGIGLATCQERTAYNATEWWFLYDNPPLPATSTPESIKIDIDAFGGVRAELGCPVWGNSPQTVASQVIAEEFGIDPADVSIEHNDSTSGAISAGPGGSRLTVMLSGAARGAAGQLREKMIRIAAHAMEVSPEDVELSDGVFRPRGVPTHTGLTFADVAMKAHLFKQTNPEGESSGLVATYTYDHPLASMPTEDRKDTGAFYPIVSHACHIPIVEVDPESGLVTMLKYYAVNDCGTVMHPKLVEGQVIGGIAQGIGAALMEEYRYDEQGALISGSFREYLMPSSHEVPEIVLEHQETPSPVTPYGVKGAGEGGRLIAPTAIAAAVDDALKPFGVWIDELPMTPERLVEVIARAEDRAEDEESGR